jgi:HK97 gp10 family phage protein
MWSSNLSVVLASLALKASKVDQAVGRAADKGKIIGVQEIQNRTPVDTGNLKGGYARATTITKPRQETREISFTSDAESDGFLYGIAVEYGTSRNRAQPHLRPGVAAAMPQIGKILKEELER